MCAIPKKHGFDQVRQRGSHIIMEKQVSGSTITVPVPDHKELRVGTLLSIIRQSQLDRSLFVLTALSPPSPPQRAAPVTHGRFKKLTGMTPSAFKEMGSGRTGLDRLE